MSRGSRWLIIGVLLGFIWMVLAGWASDTTTQRLWDAGIAGFMLILAIGLAAPSRFRWALRVIAAIVGFGYLAYFAAEAVALLRGERQPLRLSQPSATTAGLGFLPYGIPALVYALGAERVGLARLFRSSAERTFTDDADVEATDRDDYPDDYRG